MDSSELRKAAQEELLRFTENPQEKGLGRRDIAGENGPA
jgi:hypothetical protein